MLVRSRVDGQVVTINFDEGQIVHQGDLLVQIDPRPYQAALDQAKAKRQQDQANLDNTKRDLARSQSLIGNNYVTRQTLDTQTSSVAQLTAQVAADDAAIENATTQLSYATIKAPITGRVEPSRPVKICSFSVVYRQVAAMPPYSARATGGRTRRMTNSRTGFGGLTL